MSIPNRTPLCPSSFVAPRLNRFGRCRLRGLTLGQERSDDSAGSQLFAPVRPPIHHPHALIPIVGASVGAAPTAAQSRPGSKSHFRSELRTLLIGIHGQSFRPSQGGEAPHLIVFSLMHRRGDRTDGKRKRPFPVVVWRSRMIVIARGESGTRCGLRILIFSDDMAHQQKLAI
jgi:hypothetical protein